jgi:hypothetical protein
MGCTPLFLNAEPQNTGYASDRDGELADSALRISSSVSSSPPRYFSSSASSDSATARAALRGTARPSPEIGGDVGDVVLGAQISLVVVPDVSAFMRIRSTTPTKSFSAPIGSCIDDRLGASLRFLDGVDRVVEVGAELVHLVDEADARHAVLVGLAPHGLGLRLDAGLAVEHGDGAVEHAQRTLHLDGEVDVAGGVDDVDLVRCSGSCDWRFQKQVVAADVMVMPRSCSCSIQSMVAAPSCTLADLVVDLPV